MKNKKSLALCLIAGLLIGSLNGCSTSKNEPLLLPTSPSLLLTSASRLPVSAFLLSRPQIWKERQ